MLARVPRPSDERVAHASELFCSLPPPSLDEDEARGAGAGTDTGSSSSSDEGEGGAAAAKALAQPHLAEPRGVQLQGEEQVRGWGGVLSPARPRERVHAVQSSAERLQRLTGKPEVQHLLSAAQF